MPRKGWTWAPGPKAKKMVPESIKKELLAKGQELIDLVLKKKYVKKPPKNSDMNYIVEINCKWFRNNFYFYAKYRCPSKNSIAPSFNSNFARLEFQGGKKFNLAYMRHTGHWWELYQNQSLEECLTLVEEGGSLSP